jgi:hypothetical protein
MKEFKIISNGVVKLDSYLWIQSEDFPPGCRESVTIYGTTYYKHKKVK